MTDVKCSNLECGHWEASHHGDQAMVANRECGVLNCECDNFRSSFQGELQTLLNRHSQEGHSNTPDFLLAQFITQCVDAFNAATKARDKWYGVELVPGRYVKNVGGERPVLEICQHPTNGQGHCAAVNCVNYLGRFGQ